MTPKEEAIAAYGGCCIVCGITDIRLLTFDHIKGGGNHHRRQLKKKGKTLIKWLKEREWPEGFQLLCLNHHRIKTIENKEDK